MRSERAAERHIKRSEARKKTTEVFNTTSVNPDPLNQLATRDFKVSLCGGVSVLIASGRIKVSVQVVMTSCGEP
ncbi:hypothetical protein CHARACLAT_028618 [Characodon lateralis]|uniref:Uncharacterized protein n=1 Tax=Characodon lateralis TaxID=208331 RepID=A0ABU7EXK2_9TELE|nr:hypothetical protein [Characodon lateralis]